MSSAAGERLALFGWVSGCHATQHVSCVGDGRGACKLYSVTFSHATMHPIHQVTITMDVSG